MIVLRFADGCQPKYMTSHSAGADLVAREPCTIAPGKVAAVPTGVWIDQENTKQTDELFELQIRARSGLAYKNSVTLANGVGTIDADYPDEVKVLLINLGSENFEISTGMRIGQIVLSKVHRLHQLEAAGKRLGGLGSTGLDNLSSPT